ncbi:protoglobin domain-containing protein [Silvanigrella aquatica]|uniref:Globin-sensor domain-containing protein n=1 Tax=Silvanigrella aquatica TaxID=1915309 RepID=A0A1L4D1D6_9BACT|nr:protoglobin domain-containing protein [Silvanigrella aquatica]APJ04004.1 hypothetical protein AXG55_08830 [Silvanigrella aquatica]
MKNTVEFEEFSKNYINEHHNSKIEEALNFDENKKIIAQSLNLIIKENIEIVVQKFYNFNLNNARAMKYFVSKSEVDRLVEINKKYFPYLFSGPFDDAYYLEKIKIGYAHYMRNIPGNIYLASLGNLKLILNKLWSEKISEKDDIIEAQSITSDILFIEIYFTLNTYYSFAELNFQNERNRVNEILDHVQDGYFIINKNLEIGSAVSKSCFEIFSLDISGKKIDQVCIDLKMSKHDVIILCIKQYFENIFNIDSIFSMLPDIVEIFNGKTIKLKYTSILDKNKNPEKMIICAIDITEQIKIQQNIKDTYEKNLTLIQIIKHKNEFENFLKFISIKNILLLECADSKECKILLHEYKNEFSKFLLSKIASFINNLELELIEKEKIENFNAKDFFSISCCMISDMLKKFLEENYEVLGIST